MPGVARVGQGRKAKNGPQADHYILCTSQCGAQYVVLGFWVTLQEPAGSQVLGLKLDCPWVASCGLTYSVITSRRALAQYRRGVTPGTWLGISSRMPAATSRPIVSLAL